MDKLALKALRENQDLTQDELAKVIGVSRPTYIQIEQGNRELSLGEAQKLASLLNCSIDDLINDDITEIKLPKFKKEQNKIRKNKPQILVDSKRVEKLKQLLLYILNSIGGKPNVGETVIYKLLYFIDFDFYEKYEEQIIGATYIKNHYGPSPKEAKVIFNQLIKEEAMVKVKHKRFQYPQTKYVATKTADLSLFNALELKHVDEILRKYGDKSAKWLSDYSHKDIPWIGTENGKAIEYEAVFYRTKDTAVRDYGDEH